MFKYFVLFIIFLQVSTKAFALNLIYDKESLPSHIQDMNLSAASEYSFSFVVRHCREPLSVLSEIYNNGLKETAFIIDEEVRNLRIKNRGLSEHLSVLLESYGYYLGLEECYGNDTELKNDFTKMLFMAEFSSNLVGTVINAIPIAASAKLIKFLLGKITPYIGAKAVARIELALWVGGISAVVYPEFKGVYTNITERREQRKKQEELDLKKKQELTQAIEQDKLAVFEMLEQPNLNQETIDKLNELLETLDNELAEINNPN